MEWIIAVLALAFLIWRLKSIKIEFWGEAAAKSLKPKNEDHATGTERVKLSKR